MRRFLFHLFIAVLINSIFIQPIAAVSPRLPSSPHTKGDATARRGEAVRKDSRAGKSAKRLGAGETIKKSAPSKATEKKAQPLAVKTKLRQTIAEADGQSATLLPDGNWLLLGGQQKDGAVSAAAFVKDEATGKTIELSTRMLYARAGHAATMLPNGKILIWGGHAESRNLVAQAEIFNPQTQTFQEATITKATTRSGHTVTLLTDGWLLAAGGVDDGSQPINKIELINADTLIGQTVDARLQTWRRGHVAELQADGAVLLQGGFDQNNTEVSVGEIFEPELKIFRYAAIDKESREQQGEPRIVFSDPANGAADVPLNVRPALRFSELIDVKTINSQAVVLSDAGGSNIPTRLVPAENGRLLFVTPLEKLKVETQYFLRLVGITSRKGATLAETVLSFKTEEFCNDAEPPTKTPTQRQLPSAQPFGRVIDEDSYLPSAEELKSGKSKREPKTKVDDVPLLDAAPKVTALAGRVLSLGEKPLAGATLELQGQIAVTDNLGRFLLVGLKPEQSRMIIRGETVPSPGKTYATFEVIVDVDEGKTNKLPYIIWLPTVDKQNEVELATPTARETIVTTGRLPGMEVKIPAQSVLKMPTGHGMSHNLTEMTARHEMKKLGITPIPINYSPFPLPDGFAEGLLFTLQMHGAKVQGPNGEKRPGLRFVFPNAAGQAPGERVQFWNYDSTKDGWAWYGYGTVNKEGTRVIPDPGVELEGMQCLSLMTRGRAPGSGPKPGSHGFDGDPVDLQTGLFVYEQTDLVIPDTMPLKLTRTYRQHDGQRDFGVGFTHPYNMFISGDTYNYGDLILPDGGKIKFTRNQADPGPWIYRHTDTPTAFHGAEMRYLSAAYEIDYPGGGWEIKLRDGSKLIFARKTLYGDILGIHDSTTALHQIIDRFGNKLTLTRDDNLRLTRISSPNEKWIEFSYADATSTLVTGARDNIGRTVNYAYDAQFRLIKVTDVEGGESEYTYDAADRMLTLKDARGVVNLTNEYDAGGRVKKQTSADGTVYQFAYTTDAQGLGRVIQTDVTNPRGLIRRMMFNEKGFPTSETFGVGRSDLWSYSYERDLASNRVLGITDIWNQKTKFNYDGFGNLLSTVYLEGTANAVTSSATYTAFDNVATTTDALNRTVNYTYNDQGLLTKTRDWLSQETGFTYNTKGQVLTATDNIQRTSKFTYDKGALVESEDPMGRRVRQFVDAAGRATRTTDPLGGTTKYRFNKQNRPVSVVDPLGRTGALKYDKVGNILEITDSRGGKIKYTYDAMGRPLTRTNQSNQVESYQYDAFGNLWKATDFKLQITTFTYDVFNRPTLVRYHDGTTTSYAYDEKGRVLSTTDSAGGTITYGYDALDRVNRETTAAGSVGYGYDAGGRLISMQAPNQSIVTYGYDTADRVQSITQDGQAVSFGYDTADRRNLMTLPNGITVSYTYDTASQLKSMSYKRGTTTLGDVAFEYDGLGRRTHVSGSLAQILSPAAFTNGVYDAGNKQTAVNGQTLSFDQNGNLTNDGTNTYVWNARDELIGISGAVTASFQYDGEGRRISKTVNGITTSYVYDRLQAVEERQAAGPVTTNLAGGLDEVFVRKTGAAKEFLLTDALGSTWALADNTGNVTTQYKYDVFGTTQSSGATSKNPLQYTGRENDATSLYYYRNRYYSPKLRRFISRDPLKEGAGENEYSYVSNSPTNFTDPLGLQEGPVNALRNPFAPEHWVLNGLSNTVSDLLMLDTVAEAAWTIGNWCRPLSERLWAGAKLLGIAALQVFGGWALGKALGLAGRGLSALFKRIPCTPLTRWLGKACFTKGTLIHTKAGLKPIEEIKANQDEVLSYNEQTKQAEYKAVIETYVRQTVQIIKLQITGELATIETTPEHPFYTRVHRARDGLHAANGDEGEWIEAGSLQVDDKVRTPSGGWRQIVSVEQEQKSETVYNFAVADNHNYFVGEQGTLVHNSYLDGNFFGKTAQQILRRQ